MIFCIKLSTEIYQNWVVLTRKCESVAIRRYGSGSVSTCIWMGLKIGGGGVGDSAHNLFKKFKGANFFKIDNNVHEH